MQLTLPQGASYGAVGTDASGRNVTLRRHASGLSVFLDASGARGDTVAVRRASASRKGDTIARHVRHYEESWARVGQNADELHLKYTLTHVSSPACEVRPCDIQGRSPGRKTTHPYHILARTTRAGARPLTQTTGLVKNMDHRHYPNDNPNCPQHHTRSPPRMRRFSAASTAVGPEFQGRLRSPRMRCANSRSLGISVTRLACRAHA